MVLGIFSVLLVEGIYICQRVKFNTLTYKWCILWCQSSRLWFVKNILHTFQSLPEFPFSKKPILIWFSISSQTKSTQQIVHFSLHCCFSTAVTQNNTHILTLPHLLKQFGSLWILIFASTSYWGMVCRFVLLRNTHGAIKTFTTWVFSANGFATPKMYTLEEVYTVLSNLGTMGKISACHNTHMRYKGRPMTQTWRGCDFYHNKNQWNSCVTSL